MILVDAPRVAATLLSFDFEPGTERFVAAWEGILERHDLGARVEVDVTALVFDPSAVPGPVRVPVEEVLECWLDGLTTFWKLRMGPAPIRIDEALEARVRALCAAVPSAQTSRRVLERLTNPLGTVDETTFSFLELAKVFPALGRNGWLRTEWLEEPVWRMPPRTL